MALGFNVVTISLVYSFQQQHHHHHQCNSSYGKSSHSLTHPLPLHTLKTDMFLFQKLEFYLNIFKPVLLRSIHLEDGRRSHFRMRKDSIEIRYDHFKHFVSQEKTESQSGQQRCPTWPALTSTCISRERHSESMRSSEAELHQEIQLPPPSIHHMWQRR